MPSRASSYPFLLAVSGLPLCCAWHMDMPGDVTLRLQPQERSSDLAGGGPAEGSCLPWTSGAGHRGPACPLAHSRRHCERMTGPWGSWILNCIYFKLFSIYGPHVVPATLWI